MNFKELETLIGEIKDEWFPDHVETNVFSIGGRGYYENPTSDMLAFFCNSKKEHELGNLVSNALFEALGLDAFEVISTEREVNTGKGRIDLLLVGNNHVMTIENKIYHHIEDNPLDSYEKYINNSHSGKEHSFVVLSPDGKRKGGWTPLRYSDFTKQVRNNINLDLETLSLKQPVNKWLILLREFILNLEEITMTSNISKDAMKLVFENSYRLKYAAEALTSQAVIKFGEELCKSISEHFPNDDPDVLCEKTDSWAGKKPYRFPNVKFWLEKEKKWSITLRAVLFPDGKYDGNSNKTFSIWHGVCDANTEGKRKLVNEYFKTDSCERNPLVANDGSNFWFEDKRRFGFDQRNDIVELLVEKLKLLDHFHNEVEDKWENA